MKKILFINILLLWTLGNIQAQIATVELTGTHHSRNRISLNDLLQFHILSGSDAEIDAYLQIKIEQQSVGIVSVLQTGIFKLSKGLTLAPILAGVNGNKLQIFSSRSGFENITSAGFLFPEGKYNYCIELLDTERVLIHKNCSTFEQVNPFSFFLVYPFDQQELKEDRPVFTWTPLAMPAAQNFNYRIRWVEQDEKSENANAFYDHQEFFRLMDLGENLLAYKAEYPAFDPDKYYYWQVEAYSGKTILAKSDIWEFHFSKQKEPKNKHPVFVEVDLERFTDLHLFAGDYLNFKWSNDYCTIPLEYKILNQENRVVTDQITKQIAEEASSGNNFFSLNVSEIVELNKTYTLEITGNKKTYQIKFKKVKL